MIRKNVRKYEGQMYKLFDIRHVKLQFKIRFLEEGYVPRIRFLPSAVESAKCFFAWIVSDGVTARTAVFCNECIVQRIYYHKPAIVPDFVTEKGNMGYLFECDNAYKYVEKGTVMEFSMLLLGDNIVNFSTILQAVYQFGMYGIGKEGISFEIISIVNHRNESILYENNVRMDLLYPDYISRLYPEKNPGRRNIGSLQSAFWNTLDTEISGKIYS